MSACLKGIMVHIQCLLFLSDREAEDCEVYKLQFHDTKTDQI